MKQQTWYFEKLTVRAWLFHIFPRLVRERRRGRRVTQCLAFDASPWALGLASSVGWIVGATIGRVQFRIMDIRDENGMWIRLRVTYCDLAEVQQDVLREAVFHQSVGRFPFYVAKSLSTMSLLDRHTLTRALLVILICVWLRNREASDADVTLFLERRPWLENIRNYGAKYGIAVDSLARSFSFRNFLLFLLSPGAIAAIRFMFSPRTRHPQSAIRNPQSRSIITTTSISTTRSSTPTCSSGRIPRFPEKIC